MIEALDEEDPALYAAFHEDLRKADGESHSGPQQRPLPALRRGRHKHLQHLRRDEPLRCISPTGRVGCIVPSGIATDNTTKEFFSDL